MKPKSVAAHDCENSWDSRSALTFVAAVTDADDGAGENADTVPAFVAGYYQPALPDSQKLYSGNKMNSVPIGQMRLADVYALQLTCCTHISTRGTVLT